LNWNLLMYAQYWNLETNPFENDFNPAFFFPSRTHQAALLKLQYLIASNKGCGLLIGDTGAGKSFVTKMLARELDQRFAPFVHVHFPVMTAAELIGYLACQLGADNNIESHGFHVVLRSFENALRSHTAANRHPVIVIDEAHLIDEHEVFQAIQLLLNFRDETPFTLLLCGHRGLISRISRVRELDERIAIKSILQPLNRNETAEYIQHRLATAGLKGEVFDAAALNEIHELSTGTPRKINRIADLALLMGFADSSTQLTSRDIDGVADEMGIGVGDSTLRAV
jgi:type II secretory pathway predicted ATPase ExeA